MQLIVISNSRSLENETQIVTKLFEAGLETFHLRKHKLSTREMKEYIKAIPPHFHNRIVIHSHHNLTRKFKLKGIHLTKSHLRRKFRTWFFINLIKLNNPNIVISTSYGTIGSLFDDKPSFNYNYVFLSPVFDSLTSRFQSGFTEHSLKSALLKTKLNVIARGGIDISSIEKAQAIGFNGLAFYSAIWKKKDPVEEFNKLIGKFEEFAIPIE